MKFLKRIYRLLLVGSLLLNLAAAQQISYVNSVGLAVHPGFVFAHTDDARNLQSHTLGFELQLTRSQIENRKWTAGYKQPKVGCNFLYMHLGNPVLNGEAYAVVPNFETGIKINPTSDFSMRLGTGLGYLTRRFDRYENRRNLAIGSHVNGVIQLLFLYNKEFPKTRLTCGFGVTHFSNASVNVPNLGINMPSLYVASHLKSKKTSKTPFIADTLADKTHSLYFAMAFNERSLANPHRFTIGHVAWLRQKRLTSVRSWHYGADLFFDKTHHFAQYPQSSFKGLTPKQMTEVGTRVGYIWRIGKLDVSTDVGIYLYKPSKNKAFTYQMIGLKYNLTERLMIQSALKIHYGTADFFEWGLGYQFNKRG